MTGKLELGRLGFGHGAHLLVDRALRTLQAGETLVVTGTDPALSVHLRGWCREQGHGFAVEPTSGYHIVRGPAAQQRWSGAERAGGAYADGIVRHPPGHWGLAARGALVEAGGAPSPWFDIADRDIVWADLAPRLYAHAAAAQWDPATAVDWGAETGLPAEIETAVVQVMTYLVENEQAALVIPARLLARVHPHFREVQQLLAVQAADEARHMEVFARRALLHGTELGTSSVGGRASLNSLLAETDFTLASFLLSVLGEGSFLNLLAFLDEYAPDPITRQVARLARIDEARHVAFGVAHLERQAHLDPALRGRLRTAIERRHDALADTTGLNADVFDALVVLAAGEWTPDAIARGYRAVQDMSRAMADGRKQRLARLGFPPDEAAELSSLHTCNFM
jgi:hypothetical protein